MNDNFDLTTAISATEQTPTADTTAPATLPENYLVNGYEGPDALDFYGRYAREIAAKLSSMDKEQFRAFYAKVDNACCDSFEVRQRTVAKLTAAARNMVLLLKSSTICLRLTVLPFRHSATSVTSATILSASTVT